MILGEGKKFLASEHSAPTSGLRPTLPDRPTVNGSTNRAIPHCLGPFHNSQIYAFFVFARIFPGYKLVSCIDFERTKSLN